MTRLGGMALGWALATCSTRADAAEMSDAGAGVLVGVGSVGGAALGGLALGAVGVTVGLAICDGGSVDCYAPIVVGGFGGIVGAGAGAFAGVGLTAHALDRRSGHAMLGSLVGVGSGAAIGALGLATDSGGLAGIGALVAIAGVPIGGAIAAATDSEVRVTADVRPDSQGVRLSGRF